MRKPRGILDGGLYEISTRVTGEAMLMVPSAQLNDVILGVLGRALQEREPRAKLHAFVFMSNHYHALVSVPDSGTLSRLLKFVNGEIARRVNLLRDRKGAFWQQRFSAIPVTPDAATQAWRLRYILAHGVKEALVGKVGDWPGARSVHWLRDATKLVGTWTNRTRLGWAKRNKSPLDLKRYQIRYEVPLQVLPAWQSMAAAEWRRLVRDQIEDIERTAAMSRAKPPRRELLGVQAVLSVDPFSRTRSRPRRPAPSVLALDPALRVEMQRQRARRLLGAMWPYASVMTERHRLACVER